MFDLLLSDWSDKSLVSWMRATLRADRIFCPVLRVMSGYAPKPALPGGSRMPAFGEEADVMFALLWLSDIARRAATCCAGPTINPADRSMSAALELGSQA